MPRVSVWLIRTSLLHLLSGAMLGAAYLMFKAGGWPLWAVSHRPVHVEQMLVGWLVQLVIGVAFWILPRPAGHDPADRSGLMWLVFWLLNGGLLLAALAGDPHVPASLAPAGRIAETTAVLLFGWHGWHRQRPYRAGASTLLV